MAKKSPVLKEVQMTAPEETVQTPTTPVVPKLIHNKKLAVVGEYGPESELTWFITQNPRQAGRATFDRFAKYLGAPTVSAYMAAGGTKGDLLWDLRSGYLSIQGVTLSGDPVIRIPKEKKVKAPRAPKVPKIATETQTQADPSEEVRALEEATREETV